MKVIAPEAHIEGNFDGMALLKQIEAAGRTCYKSEDKITDESCISFIRGIIKRGHEAVIEHGAITVRFITDRGVTHEIVRHRLAAYCQESTRYCNYGQDKFDNQVTFIQPTFWNPHRPEDMQYQKTWREAMQNAENSYLLLLSIGATPQQARSVLPNSLKTELVMTANPREWRHFFKMRCSSAAHPDIQYVARRLLAEFHEKIPVLFDDIYEEYKDLIPDEVVVE